MDYFFKYTFYNMMCEKYAVLSAEATTKEARDFAEDQYQYYSTKLNEIG
jgi:hypothetical protein